MSAIPHIAPPAQNERATQNRIVALFQHVLGYEYLGNWAHRADNSNVEAKRLTAWLLGRGTSEAAARRAVELLEAAASNPTLSLYDLNKAVYSLLRYGVTFQLAPGEPYQTVHLIDWAHPQANDFALAEEVTVAGHYTKRPDIVLYVNGIALGVLELKRSSVDVSHGIRQNLDNQTREFILPFFATVQLVMAGNDTQGLRYGVIGTNEKYALTWSEEEAAPGDAVRSPLDRALLQLCAPARLLEIIHDFIVFDAGWKKTCRHHQYFGVRAAQVRISQREGGIIWHTQGSGKSLTMVWLAKWIREHDPNGRVLILTDREELDRQIEKVFLGVDEQIYRTRSGADLLATLRATQPWLICSLIHKFGRRDDGDVDSFVKELQAASAQGFAPHGNLYLFVDECHRTQSGKLHEAMKALLPNALIIGFTGTPLLARDKQTSLEVFGSFIHTYRYDQAVRDGVVLDLRYEARDIDQRLTSPARVDAWFESKTSGLTDLAKAQLKARWGTMQRVLSTSERLDRIVSDIMFDMETRARLMDGHGNALLVSDSILNACRLYEKFTELGFANCAIVTSYEPTAASISGASTGEGTTEELLKYAVYRKMLARWFNQSEDEAATRVAEFENAAREKFIKEPGQLKLLIVVDMLLTGFDAPPATYLYIDKPMRDHGLFQAICRVNRIDEGKDYGYIVDYRDLFKSLEQAVTDYTSEALDGYDTADVTGLLTDRLEKGRERLDEALDAVRALCEPVAAPRDDAAYRAYFGASDPGDGERVKETEPLRVALYKLTATLIRAFADIANEMEAAGYTAAQAATIKQEVTAFADLRDQIKLASGDAIDLKMYEPGMRSLLDSYIKAEDSKKISAFDDLSLVQLLVKDGASATIDKLPEGLRKDETAVAETIENNVRKIITDEMPVNPKYYERLSDLLKTLVAQRRDSAIDYAAYLQQVVELAKAAMNPAGRGGYPSSLHSVALRALYDNLGNDEAKALAVDKAVRDTAQDGWRGNTMKERRVRNALRGVLGDEAQVDAMLELVRNQREY